MYGILSNQVPCNEGVRSSIGINQLPADDDSDDVYYRFGGSATSEMLHIRYQKRQSTDVSNEITILQSIDTTVKSGMPKYLNYRNRGYMYKPHPSFIPFFREVDKCIKEVVNPTGFQQHSHELVKVRNLV